MEKPKVVLFDLDGTLLDNSDIIIEAYYDGMIKLGYKPKPREFIRTLLGKNTFTIGLNLELQEEDLPKIDAHFWEFFGKYTEDNKYVPRVYSGVKDILQILKDNSVPVGIVTSNKARFAKKLMKKVALDEFILTYIGQEDVKKTKPSSEPLLLALEKLGINKLALKDKTVWFVGDSSSDIEAANNAGFYAIGVPEKDKILSVKEKNPDFIVNSLTELSLELKKLL